MTPRVLIEPARLAGSSVLSCQTDDRLVDLVRAGNDRAFEAIVDRYRRPLVRYCARLLPPSRAEDAVQQAFLNAFAGLRRGEQRIELRPWLYRIAHNAALNQLRENGWAHERIETAAHRAVGETAHDAAERRASLRTVLAAVQDLPERQRDAVILRALEGRTYDQIAVELDATGGAVRQLLNRARHTLRTAATALTPTWLLVRLPWGSSAPVVQRVAEAVSHDGLRGGAARTAGVLAASVALAAGLSTGTHDASKSVPDGSLHAQERPASVPSPQIVAAALPGGAPRLVRRPPAELVREPRRAASRPRRAVARARAHGRNVPARPRSAAHTRVATAVEAPARSSWSRTRADTGRPARVARSARKGGHGARKRSDGARARGHARRDGGRARRAGKPGRADAGKARKRGGGGGAAVRSPSGRPPRNGRRSGADGSGKGSPRPPRTQGPPAGRGPAGDAGPPGRGRP